MKFPFILTTLSSIIASPLRNLETQLLPKYSKIIGVDEAGRGALAGPVTAAAVCATYNLIIDDSHSFDLNSLMIKGVDDSKVLSAKKREEIYEIITSASSINENYIISSCHFVNEKVIDDINILEASMLAMKESINDLITTHMLDTNECYGIIDGNKIPKGLSISARPLIKGDSLCYPCSLASIIAKVSRDRFMVEMGHKYPEYGFEKHKGYATKAHLMAIHKYGASPIHRLSFKPLKGR